MSVDPQVSASVGTQDRPSVAQSDFNSYRSVMDKKVDRLAKTVDVERQARQAAEHQLSQLLQGEEKKLVASLSPDERAKYLQKKSAQQVLKLREDNRRLREQARLDAERDRVLRQYQLRGDEEGLDYGSFEALVRTAHATAVRRQAVIQQAMQRQTQSATQAAAQSQAGEQSTTGEQSADVRAPAVAPRIDTHGPARGAVATGLDDLGSISWRLTKGSLVERKAAMQELRDRRRVAAGA